MAKEITGRTVLIGMVAFFGLIIAVNMVFVYFALDSWPGLSVDLHLKRPTREGIDRQLNLTQAEPSLYKGRAENLPAGRWTAEVTAKGAGVGDYFLVHDVLVEK